ncbi:UNVERIFIED_CONTAM: hypothetical protein FKN15_001236 [Acipenser sinensis]
MAMVGGEPLAMKAAAGAPLLPMVVVVVEVVPAPLLLMEKAAGAPPLLAAKAMKVAAGAPPLQAAKAAGLPPLLAAKAAGLPPLQAAKAAGPPPLLAAAGEPAGTLPLLAEVGAASHPPTAVEAEPAGIHPLLVEVGGASSPETAAMAPLPLALEKAAMAPLPLALEKAAMAPLPLALEKAAMTLLPLALETAVMAPLPLALETAVGTLPYLQPGSASQSQIPSEETGFFRLGGCGSSLTLAGCSGSFLSCHGGGWSGATCLTSPTAKHHSSPFRQDTICDSLARSGVVDDVTDQEVTDTKTVDGRVKLNGYHSLNVQIICNHQLLITNVVAKCLGVKHDALIWRNCVVKDIGEEGGWLLGDSGYSLLPFLLRPVQTPTSRAEEKYNTAHAKTRQVIERCIGATNIRFRALHTSGGALQYSPEKCVKIIIVACVLHNISQQSNMTLKDINDGQLEQHDQPEHVPESSQGHQVRHTLIQDLNASPDTYYHCVKEEVEKVCSSLTKK